MKHTKAARFFESIVSMKNDSKGFQHMHISFQSTSSCNTTSVNALNECTNCFELREKVICKNKEQWVIEMSYYRRIYLETYLQIDVLDGNFKMINFYTEFGSIGIIL